MTVQQAITIAYMLHKKWVSTNDISMGRGYDLERIRASIRSEMHYNLIRPERCTLECKKETHADAILLGKASKALTGMTARIYS